MREGEFIDQELEKGGGRIPVDFSGASPALEASTANPAIGFLEQNGNHYLAEKLNMTHFYRADPQIETKVNEIERYFQNAIKEFGLPDSIVSYDALLEQATQTLGPLEELIRSRESMKIVDHIFSKIALQNQKSNETYLKHAEENRTKDIISRLVNGLDELVKSVKEALHGRSTTA